MLKTASQVTEIRLSYHQVKTKKNNTSHWSQTVVGMKVETDEFCDSREGNQ